MDALVKLTPILSFLAALVAAFWALFIYKSNARRERARWVENLYSRFFEKEELKEIRDIVDCDSGDAHVAELVANESSQWTDYLNFFELVAYLQVSGQLEEEDVSALFAYYLGCLKKHKPIIDYISNESKGFEQLKKLLSKI
ncbi:MAG: hypothetical protein WCA49_15070 [Candidatus Sulfotelmatobacter sp.]